MAKDAVLRDELVIITSRIMSKLGQRICDECDLEVFPRWCGGVYVVLAFSWFAESHVSLA